MVLTRTVWRTLADGKQIVVKRRYRVAFERRADGYMLNGQFLDASVDAPPLLAGMAELERRRADSGPFPLRLDATGLIHHEPAARGPDSPMPEQALRQGQNLIRSSSLTQAERDEANALLSQLALQRATSAWPVDLFNPAPGEHRELRQIALPDGQEGEIEVKLTVLAMLPEGLPQAVERTVVTDLAGSHRVSRERWSLEPLAEENR
jgi:hypothetical protein